MTNHIHLVAVPEKEEGLQRLLKPLHMRYAQRINRARGWKGHVWQGRFFSSPLDEAYLWAAIRYVERNPVRAKMVLRAEDYPWSSAATKRRERSALWKGLVYSEIESLPTILTNGLLIYEIVSLPVEA